MTDIHAKTNDQMDFAGFKSFVDQNFSAEKSVQTKDKGISQLIRQLKNLSGDAPQLRNYLDGKRADRLSVYPVLLYSDSVLDLSGVNESLIPNFSRG